MAGLGIIPTTASSAGILLSHIALSETEIDHTGPLSADSLQYGSLPPGLSQAEPVPRPRSRSSPAASTPSSTNIAAYGSFSDMMEINDDILKQATRACSFPIRTPVTWPMGELPVELYVHIFSFLGRNDLKSFRRTCREFDSIAIQHYFKNVVVSFRPELYGEIQSGSWPHIMSDGQRILSTSGDMIRRFALSVELDEEALAFPPIKTFQEVIPCYWGLYRWPYSDYHRYKDLSELERAADDTSEMKAALRHLESVSNLGFSCDTGLGYLLGPHGKSYTIPKTPIFRTRDHEPLKHLYRSIDSSTTLIESTRSGSRANWPSHKERLLERMTVEAGYRAEEVPEAIALLMCSEGRNLSNSGANPRDLMAEDVFLDSAARYLRNQPFVQALSGTEGGRRPPLLRVENGSLALIPNQLTIPQKEMLLELEWAHRAMTQSYVLAIIDNANMGSFKILRSLTIAKIPSCHVPIFTRHDLWDALDGLEEVSLGVIADWRRISKGPLGEMFDEPISPTRAVPKVFELLQNYIGICENIHTLHFEWICGGELARGTFQRNKYILPAPFVQSGEMMAMTDAITNPKVPILRLPHVKRFSLKNCWCSPHVLVDMTNHMALSSLEMASFESVSLAGPPTHNVQNPLYHGVSDQGIQFIQAQITAQDDDSTLQHVEEHARLPSQYTWAGLIDHFLPVSHSEEPDQDYHQPTKRRLSFYEPFDEAYTPKRTFLPRNAERYKLERLSFKSCGYVAVDNMFVNTRLILPPGANGVRNFFTEPASQRNMQQDDSELLGVISQYTPAAEREVLSVEFGMEFGWSGVYHSDVIEEALDDGVEHPGEERFTGSLTIKTGGARYDRGAHATLNSSDETLRLLGGMNIDDDG